MLKHYYRSDQVFIYLPVSCDLESCNQTLLFAHFNSVFPHKITFRLSLFSKVLCCYRCPLPQIGSVVQLGVGQLICLTYSCNTFRKKKTREGDKRMQWQVDFLVAFWFHLNFLGLSSKRSCIYQEVPVAFCLFLMRCQLSPVPQISSACSHL